MYLSVVLAEPDPSGSTGIVSALSGLLPALAPIPEFRLPSTSPGCCDSQAVVVSHLHSVQQRLVAHNVGQPQLIRSISSKLVPGPPVGIDNRAQIVVNGWAGFLPVLRPALTEVNIRFGGIHQSRVREPLC